MIELARLCKGCVSFKRSQSLTFVALCKQLTSVFDDQKQSNFLQANFWNSLFQYLEKVVFSLHFLFHPNSY